MTVHDTRFIKANSPDGWLRRLARHAALWLDMRRVTLAQRRRERANRKALLEVLDHEDWLYNDLGITRGDVVWAGHLPMHVNACRELERIRARYSLGR